ncbi:MAG: NADH-quinone oxidoreductase subunit M [Planctomycetota bacterium]|nr:NADH-quinone oxidoreductase subunit M [Planctomycetota bacterium]
MTSTQLLSFLVFFPAAGAAALAFFPKHKIEAMRWFTLGVTAIVALLAIWMCWQGGKEGQFSTGEAALQSAFSHPWISSFNIFYFMGLDGISFPLVVLTAVLCVFVMGASWTITRHVKAYCILFLLLETGMLGVFMSLDFFLFYVFWEVMLLPMYFLIGVWGGPRREYAAIKFFLYTLVGSVLMLIAILALYFSSDLGLLTPQQLVETRVAKDLDVATELAAKHQTSPGGDHTFNIMALAKIGQHPNSPFNVELLWGKSLQWWAFLLLFIGFAIKVPAVPVHTWLPDAHVEAPTPISMILAGVLLKMGGYGIIRICYPICPDGGYELATFVCTIGVLSMVYGAFAALAQKDFKRMVAYSSVSHMGYVVLGLGVWSATKDYQFDPKYWAMGMNGAMFQMIAHGISSAGMFFMVGVIYERVHHRNLDEFGGLFARMPVYSGLAIGIFFAGLGLPGLCGFIGEVLVTLSVWNYSHALAVISASVVVLTAAYILWALQRVYLGAEYKGPNADHITPMTRREFAIAAPLLVLAIWFGVMPQSLFNYMEPSVTKTADDLATWTRTVKNANLMGTDGAVTEKQLPAATNLVLNQSQVP